MTTDAAHIAADGAAWEGMKLGGRLVIDHLRPDAGHAPPADVNQGQQGTGADPEWNWPTK